MDVLVVKDYEAMSRKGADIISALLTLNGKAVLGLATGSTPVGMYKELVKRNKEGVVSFKDVTTVNLDEYYPISPENNQSYRYFMNQNLFNDIDIDKTRTHVLNGLSSDPDKECRDYEDMIESLGGIDLQVLGIGRNGHIGFNEPSDHFEDETHCVDLTETTIQANKRFFESEADVPRQAYTMGIGTIMRCKKILVVVSGSDKAQILKKVVQGPVTPQVPGSILQFHPDCTIIADEATLSEMDI